jgi:CBS domain-containing protein
MTPDPEFATVDMPILDALRTMQERKFLHLPVMDRGAYNFSGENRMHGLLEKHTELITLAAASVVLTSNAIHLADGSIISIIDVIDIAHAAISIVRALCSSISAAIYTLHARIYIHAYAN